MGSLPASERDEWSEGLFFAVYIATVAIAAKVIVVPLLIVLKRRERKWLK
jgi:heme/copper-type cytochrome/quinol oxidase subunit 2